MVLSFSLILQKQVLDLCQETIAETIPEHWNGKFYWTEGKYYEKVQKLLKKKKKNSP